MTQAITSLQAAKLLLRLRGRRLLNMYSSRNPFRKRGVKGHREGTAAKGKSFALLVFVAIYLLGMIALLGMSAGWSFRREFPDPLVFPLALSLHFAWQFFGLAFLGLGNRELAQGDSDIEWLSSLPAELPPLLLGKILERAFFSLFAIVMIVQFTSLQRAAHLAWPLVLLKVLFLLIPLMFASALWQMTLEYLFRTKLSPAKLRNTSAIFGIFGTIPLILSFQMSTIVDIFRPLTTMLPSWVYWFVPFLLPQMGIDHGLDGFAGLVVFLLQLNLFLGLGYLALQRILARGFDANTSRDAKRGKTASKTAKRDWAAWTRLSPLARRELTLLKRDKSYFMQVIVGPIVMVGFNLYSSARILNQDSGSASAFYFVFFISSIYLTSMAAFQAINSEGNSLWIISSLPLSLEGLLKKKLRVWMAFSYLFTTVTLLYCHFGLGLATSRINLFRDLAIFLGVFFYSWIAMAIGVLNSDPMAEQVQKRIKQSSLYFFMGLTTLYLPVFTFESYWLSFVVIVMVACVSYSLWQEASSYLPYSLDPTSAPPSEISFVHGSVATLIFFLLQNALAFFFLDRIKDRTLLSLVAYLGAGILVLIAMHLYLGKKETLGQPRWFGPKKAQNTAIGLGAGLILGAIGLFYTYLNMRYHWFETAKPAEDFSLWKLVLLAIFIAPPVEEYLFRGVLFQGLEKRFSLPWAIFFGALIFAIVHPASSFVPVFLGGILMAFLFQRTRNLWTSIVCHGTYNLIVTIGTYYLFF